MSQRSLGHLANDRDTRSSLIAALLAIAALTYRFRQQGTSIATVVRMFINIMVVAGLYVFVGKFRACCRSAISASCASAPI